MFSQPCETVLTLKGFAREDVACVKNQTYHVKEQLMDVLRAAQNLDDQLTQVSYTWK